MRQRSALVIPDNVPIYYSRRYSKCGKDHCRICLDGKGHGPYVYANWRGDGGKKYSKYVGKELPPRKPRLIPDSWNAPLIRARLDRGWSMTYIADRVGVCVNSYKGWERGLHVPRRYPLRMLCRVFGLSAEQLGFVLG